MVDSPSAPLFQCPRCRRAPLALRAPLLVCSDCHAEYPLLDGIPWLFADPGRALGEWRNRLTAYLEEFAAATRAVDADLAANPPPVTRERLLQLREGYLSQLRLVGELLAPLRLTATPLSQAAQQAMATRLPMSQDLHSYYANAHRDWAWGSEENERSLALVSAALGSGRQRVLVLGAGACRLTYDLHQLGAHALTVGLDISPLLLLAAGRILAGGAVSLVEFPLAPRSRSDVAVQRELRAPAPARPGLQLVFADAWQAPFAAQSFDAVVTPWLIDIVDLDFSAIAAHVNRLLVAGGRWVNFGSLAFPWRRPALRLSREEIGAALGEAGFSIELMRDEELPYMKSPVSRHSRREQVLTFSADKQKRAPRDAPQPGPPAWLATHSLPVPRSPSLALAANASHVQAVLLALVDGKRSIDDLVRIISEQGLLSEDQARSALCGLLERLHATAERTAGVA
jgi:uncharacterized protein YbaR (Trm112 family)